MKPWIRVLLVVFAGTVLLGGTFAVVSLVTTVLAFVLRKASIVHFLAFILCAVTAMLLPNAAYVDPSGAVIFIGNTPLMYLYATLAVLNAIAGSFKLILAVREAR